MLYSYTALIYLQAFDLLRPELLVERLRELGVTNTLIRVIYSFLTDRSYCVDIEGSISTLKNLPIRCVQGSVLGPILFSIYLGDLKNIIPEAFVLSYADDSYVAIGYNPDNIQNTLRTLESIC